MFYDVIVIGGGAAGLMCAIQAGKRGRRTLIIDHAKKIGSKIIISGGGRCNFTNRQVTSEQYVSNNPHFCTSALSRFSPQDFIEWVKKHKIKFHEKKLGQLFCDHTAKDIVQMLIRECDRAHVEMGLGCSVSGIAKNQEQFEIKTTQGDFVSSSLVIATGGLSIPKLGASGFGYKIAKQFGLQMIPTHPALDGFMLGPLKNNFFEKLAGVSMECIVSCNGESFRENILFTHKGVSGPAALQASLYWNKGDVVTLDLLPAFNSYEWLLKNKKLRPRLEIKNLLSEMWPMRFSEFFCQGQCKEEGFSHRPLQEIKDKGLELFSKKIHAWQITPWDTVGYQKAEVTRGGVDTHELSSKTMEAKKVKGLYFIGEVVDVTGQLGGYNFQWAWSSGWAAGQVV
ncbi:MAG: hypothetical protein A2Z91_07245 [Deltaproteobacteria bacterium GWA2_38_16]|nr:MAG: hypothetical protein A2Z91_07245 [Deltaproteobacteria bacterium GWA2_38_16]OGQ02705.1 MAG: hypothetical protein A3D19_00580 [Deltaproteobacteria bacterium RIFCSPHIGHO2_02_FULL_38_15]OGQ34062.1 MAG: hypothetical protein A3A72_00955 [Deltaproteobacteria bacterium RIFCSPLOWO2_01_FULL_38_9]